MKLGIPTLCRYDLLDQLLASADAGSERPTGYIIIDNGGGYTRARLMEKIPRLAPYLDDIQIVHPGRNIGVPASWNKILEMAGDEPVVISNDDIVFGPETFAQMVAALRERPFVGAAGGWALFGQTPQVTRTVGWYDEQFYPAYYEDCDYMLRCHRAGVPLYTLPHPVQHAGNASTFGASAEMQAAISEGREHGYAYFISKWGADSPRWGNALVTNYKDPFDGQLPPGWSERTPVPDIAPLRWDIINHVAEAIGAERYLEIGVSDGSCLRRIRVREKWGIDPYPNPDGVRAASVYVPQTSDAFFAELGERAGMFDLVFIDGDHRADQVYREVKSAIRMLTPKGVILLHDCNPHNEEMQEVPLRSGYQWTGDVWKGIARLRSEGMHTVNVIASDFGVGVVIPNRVPAPMSLSVADLTWQSLVRDRAELLGIVPSWRWKEWLAAVLGNRDLLQSQPPPLEAARLGSRARGA